MTTYTGVTKQDICNQLARDYKFKGQIKNIIKQEWWQDLFNDVLLQILEAEPEQKIVDMGNSGQIRYWFIRVINNNLSQNCSTNKIYQYEPDYTPLINELKYQLQEDKDMTYLIPYIEKEIDNLFWYDKNIFLIYLSHQDKTLKEIESLVNIKKHNLWYTVNKVKKQIKHNLNHLL